MFGKERGRVGGLRRGGSGVMGDEEERGWVGEGRKGGGGNKGVMFHAVPPPEVPGSATGLYCSRISFHNY